MQGSFYSMKNISGKQSSDGQVYLGGVAFRVNQDGTGLRPIGHNFRNSYEQAVSSLGDVFQNDNDDPPASRTAWLMENMETWASLHEMVCVNGVATK